MLGGIDHQLGQLDQDYAKVQMVERLAAFLPESTLSLCAAQAFSGHPEGASA